MTDKKRILYLIDKSFSATLTEAEKAEFDEWLLSGNNRDSYVTMASEWMMNNQRAVAYDEQRWQPVLNKVLRADKQAPVIEMNSRKRGRTRYVAVAAAAVLLLATSGIIWRLMPAKPEQNKMVADIPPGHKGAFLTLSDGRVIELDSIQNGVVASEQGAAIHAGKGQIVYGKGNEQLAALYNTISTPAGRQFTITLPDGSRVWLNAASSLRYPVAFSAKERLVSVTGEAYFEIAADKNKPFKVATQQQGEVEVLGTEFNISTYNDEPEAATTLVSGAVKVNSGKGAITLQPGQQALVTQGSMPRLNSHVDIAQVTAWKNGSFNFENQSLEQIMRQIGRWYNIEVVYAGAVPHEALFGGVGRNLTLKQVLLVLEKSGIKYRLEENNKLIILP